MLHDVSPTVHLEDGFRFSFWANENREPPHVHVRKGDAIAKWWLDPIAEDYSVGFNPSQRSRILHIVQQNHFEMLERWHATHRKDSSQ